MHYPPLAMAILLAACAGSAVVPELPDEDPRKMTEESDEVIIVHVPSLVATLLDAERRKGSPLTEAEVIDIRDNSPARAIRPEELQALVERRGYEDIDPEDCWAAWCAIRDTLSPGGA